MASLNEVSAQAANKLQRSRIVAVHTNRPHASLSQEPTHLLHRFGRIVDEGIRRRPWYEAPVREIVAICKPLRGKSAASCAQCLELGNG